MSEQWRCAGHAGDLSEDAPLEFKLDGTEIGIYKVGDELYALENVCPHAYALLTQGFVDGDTVECPLHEAVFHIRNISLYMVIIETFEERENRNPRLLGKTPSASLKGT